jgi:hypothetical protein
MSEARERSVEAAARILYARAGGAPLSAVRVELAAWAVGASGGTPPRLSDPAEDLQARLAAMLGAGDHAASEAFLIEHMPTPPGEKLIFSACSLAGDAMADRLIELAHRFHSPWFFGPMLTRTTQLDRLLALFPDRLGGHGVHTVGELVIAGRDAGAPIAAAEARWAPLAAQPHWNLSYLPEYRDIAVRIKAREDLEEAIDLLETFEDAERPGRVFEGAQAVLARLVLQDPSRAAAVAADAVSPQDRVVRLQGLTWWFELPDVAEPLVDELLGERDPYVELSLVDILANCGAPSWLERALANAASQPPLEVADQLALAVHALRVAGRHDDAERVRDQLLPALAAQPIAPGTIAPRDLFEVISAPGRPTLAPWRTPGLPHDCP